MTPLGWLGRKTSTQTKFTKTPIVPENCLPSYWRRAYHIYSVTVISLVRSRMLDALTKLCKSQSGQGLRCSLILKDSFSLGMPYVTIVFAFLGGNESTCRCCALIFEWRWMLEMIDDYSASISGEEMQYVNIWTQNKTHRAKQKGVFEHAQNAQIQIHPTHAQCLIRTFTSIDAFCSVQWFW